MALTHKGRIGLGGGVELLHGLFVHTGSAASESFVVDGVVIGYGINHNSSSESKEAPGVSVSSSTSGYKITLTFRYNAPVAAGTYWMLIKHG